MADHNEIVDVTRRALAHLEDRTTDMADSTYTVPVEEYLDEAQWRAEMDAIFKGKPLALVLSAELREPGAFKALDAMGTPVLVTRGEDGVARAFLNVCRHRGSPVAPEGCGVARDHTCPYHGWLYGNDGSLLAVAGQPTFGEVDQANMGLTELPAEERCGFVWVVLTPGLPIDLDEWLGDFAAELDDLELDQWHVYRQTELIGGGWKVTFDGYLEGYHFATLHGRTIGKNVINNLMVTDQYGPHQRIVFANKSIKELSGVPEDQWDPAEHLGPVHSVFPNISIANVWTSVAAISQLYPGPTFDTSLTVQTVITREPVEGEDAIEDLDHFAEAMAYVVQEEDYGMGQSIQRVLGAGANTHFTFGRNEPTLHHYHGWVDKLMEQAQA